MSKPGVKFLAITFLIMLIGWGTCVVLGLYGLTLSNCMPLYLPFLLGGFSPTLASYIVLKQEKGVGLRSWLAQIFDFRQSLLAYLLPAILILVYGIPQLLISGYDQGAPFAMLILLIPMMVFGGGNEEAGWRHVLQPELEKRLPFVISTVLVALVWWLWHLPLFYIPGVGQYGTNYLLFGVSVLGLSFALAAIKRITGSTLLCLLFHCLVNALLSVFIVHEDLLGYVVSASLLILVSVVLVLLSARFKVLLKTSSP